MQRRIVAPVLTAQEACALAHTAQMEAGQRQARVAAKVADVGIKECLHTGRRWFSKNVCVEPARCMETLVITVKGDLHWDAILDAIDSRGYTDYKTVDYVDGVHKVYINFSC
jgi:hypothetical protein